MELVNDEITMAKTDDGAEYISEWETVLTDTDADGTEYVAEITTTSSEDDPTDVEAHMTLTTTEEDGTETVTEYIANDDGVFKVEEESEFEQAVEAAFGIEIQDELTPVEVNESAYQATETTDEMDFGSGNMDHNAGVYGSGDTFNAYEPTSTYNSSFGTTDTTIASDYLYTGTGPDIDHLGAITGDSSSTDTSSADMQYNAEYNANYSDYYQDQADIAYSTAVDYAEHGDYDAAQVYADSGDTHQAAADDWADAPID